MKKDLEPVEAYFLAVLSAFIALMVRACIKGAMPGDAAIVIGLCALMGFQLYLAHKQQKPVNDELKEELRQLKSQVDGLKMSKVFSKT